MRRHPHPLAAGCRTLLAAALLLASAALTGAAAQGSAAAEPDTRPAGTTTAASAAHPMRTTATPGTRPVHGESAGAATAEPTGTTTASAPDPAAPHRGRVTGARTPDRSPARDRAVRAFAEGRRAAAREGGPDRYRRPARPDADLTHDWWGVFPRPGTHDGITATHTVDPAYHVRDSENFTYAPTTKAQNSCMEVVTAYWQSGPELWAWDWCGAGGPAKTLPIDAAFLAKYTPGGTAPAAYSVQLVREGGSGNTWGAYLYNHRTASWELLYRQSGKDQSGLDHGWDMFEIYASVNPATGVGWYCTEARNTVFDSSAVKLRRDGAWNPASPADSPWTDPAPNGRDFLCPALRFLRAGANDHWTVRQ
ncbi:carbohydrate-binding protein [Streptomyces mobaraensis]|uniref:Carbohydrate-binding protein n=1 Tax=Streptomyces mobaraensis TaxID=35621 RepID=A0A5N5W5V7_STRMB|nr:carbohydrate-binding protein [Streptomyces mobaraensis]KAB7839965.1 carbohydrate-binding protein [Streptomyces mobaraensis]